MITLIEYDMDLLDVKGLERVRENLESNLKQVISKLNRLRIEEAKKDPHGQVFFSDF